MTDKEFSKLKAASREHEQAKSLDRFYEEWLLRCDEEWGHA